MKTLSTLIVENIEGKFAEFKEMLEKHDFFYEQSDDHSQYTKGLRGIEAIRCKYRELAEHDRARADSIMVEFGLQPPIAYSKLYEQLDNLIGVSFRDLEASSKRFLRNSYKRLSEAEKKRLEEQIVLFSFGKYSNIQEFFESF